MTAHWLWFVLSSFKDKANVDDDDDNDNSLSPHKFKETDNNNLISLKAILISTPV
jgi:hypothetical protein